MSLLAIGEFTAWILLALLSYVLLVGLLAGGMSN
jgi:hypothetical protein